MMMMMMADYHHGANHSAGVSDRFSMRQLRSSISSAAIDAGDRFFFSLFKVFSSCPSLLVFKPILGFLKSWLSPIPFLKERESVKPIHKERRLLHQLHGRPKTKVAAGGGPGSVFSQLFKNFVKTLTLPFYFSAGIGCKG